MARIITPTQSAFSDRFNKPNRITAINTMKVIDFSALGTAGETGLTLFSQNNPWVTVDRDGFRTSLRFDISGKIEVKVELINERVFFQTLVDADNKETIQRLVNHDAVNIIATYGKAILIARDEGTYYINRADATYELIEEVDGVWNKKTLSIDGEFISHEVLNINDEWVNVNGTAHMIQAKAPSHSGKSTFLEDAIKNGLITIPTVPSLVSAVKEFSTQAHQTKKGITNE